MTKSDKTAIKKEAMIEALQRSLGVVTAACKSVEITRETFYRWLKDDKKFADKVADVPEIAIDYVESKLYQLIKNENPTAIIFYLKTKAKHRGYQENYDVTSGNKPFQIILEKSNG